MGERRGFGMKHDVHARKWEESDFPILCGTCLGQNQFIRMTKAAWEKECRICTTPVMVFSWKPDDKSRFKTTEICQTCAKVKNVCSSCLFDLQFGLPMQVRDSYLNGSIEIPKEAMNRDFWAFLNNKNIDKLDLPYEKEGAYPVLEKYSENKKKVKKSPLICSLFVKGICAKGEACPYTHAVPDVTKLTDDQIKERFAAVRDPIKKKIMREYELNSAPSAPLDKRVTTLYVGGFSDDSFKEKDFSRLFERFGEIKNVKIDLQKFFVVITFKRRECAEAAMEEMHNKLEIKGQKYKLIWGKTGTEKRVAQKKTDAAAKNTSTYKTKAGSLKQISKNKFMFGDLAKPMDYSSLKEDVIGNYDLLGKKKM